MFSKTRTLPFIRNSSDKITKLATALQKADAIVIGAGAGLSAAAGMTYSGQRFETHFSDFRQKYGIQDMYAGSFYPFETLEEYWAFTSRKILLNRYQKAPLPVYETLLNLVNGREYFVLTTNVDHQFQMAGFEKTRLFYTQGDYGLWQCSKPCCQKTWDNEEPVRRMVEEQKDMRIPSELIPHCPVCGRPMAMNLRSDSTFVEDEGWHQAARRYEKFLQTYTHKKILFLELGVGYNTPSIIKYPFWQMTYQNPQATYCCLNLEDIRHPQEIAGRIIAIAGDIGATLQTLIQKRTTTGGTL